MEMKWSKSIETYMLDLEREKLSASMDPKRIYEIT